MVCLLTRFKMPSCGGPFVMVKKQTDRGNSSTTRVLLLDIPHNYLNISCILLRGLLRWITLSNTQNVMETRLAKLYYFEAAEFENDIEIFSLALVFELQLWPEISLFFQLNFRYPSSKVGKTLSGRRNSHTTTKSRDRLSSLQVFVTWSVKLLPVNSLQFLLSVAWKRLYCRWCPQVLLWELFRDSCSCHSTVQYIYKNVPKVRK